MSQNNHLIVVIIFLILCLLGANVMLEKITPNVLDVAKDKTYGSIGTKYEEDVFGFVIEKKHNKTVYYRFREYNNYSLVCELDNQKTVEINVPYSIYNCYNAKDKILVHQTYYLSNGKENPNKVIYEEYDIVQQ